MHTKLRHLGIAAAATALMACTPDVEPTPVETIEFEAPIQQRAGSVLAEFEGGESTRVHAQFLHVRGISTDQALHALSVWSPDHELDLGACSIRSYDVAASGEIRIEMLDVGPIRIDHLDRSIQLDGRRLPDLIGGVSGVVYGTEETFDADATRLHYEPGTPYRIAAPGQDLNGFDVDVEAPEVPTIVMVSGQPIEDTPRIRQSDGFDIEWIPAGIEIESELHVEIRSSAGPNLLRCHLEDDGFFSLPAGVVAQLGQPGDLLEIALRRAQIVEADVDGLDRAEVVFAATNRAEVEIVEPQN